MRKNFLYLCYYDPAGISTVPQIVTHMRAGSSFDLTVINLFEHINLGDNLSLNPSVDLDNYEGIIIHNTISYNVYNLRALDLRTRRKLKDYRGVKILMKQDENHLMIPLAQYIGETGFDVIFTCLGEADIPKVYPPELVGTPRFERMLTGYVTPALRTLPWNNQDRPIDIGYRGSIQPLSFGRLAYEKRQIGNEVSARLAGSDVVMDISSRWEDRIGGDAWFEFMGRCKAVLGSESGASVFNLNGELEQACREAERKLGKEREDAEYAEAYLAHFAHLEGNVDYAQISPRHFEAAACGAVQILYPGNYSGILTAGIHYFPLERDFSNLAEAVAFIRDEPRRFAMAEAAHRDVIASDTYWIETFVTRFDQVVQEAMERRGSGVRTALPLAPKAKRSPLSMQTLIHLWVRLPYPWQQRLKPYARKILALYHHRPASTATKKLFRDVANYWTNHNVTLHKRFNTREESLEYFHWRCDQYPGYLDLMPVKGHDGKHILDFGCGPGHDLVGFCEYSDPASLTGCDVSAASIAEAKTRMRLHRGKKKFPLRIKRLRADTVELPFADASFDYIHSSGVIHHVPDLQAVLKEFKRILKPNGRIRVMVYNANSIWMHLYVAHILRYRDNSIPAELPIRDAFTRSTDGPDCPIANCYTVEEFSSIAAASGLKTRLIGAACALSEIQLAREELQNALANPKLEAPHREFLQGLTFDGETPLHNGVPAGIDLILEMTV